MPHIKLPTTKKDLAMWTAQIAIHIWISFVLNLHKWKSNEKKTKIQTFYLKFFKGF